MSKALIRATDPVGNANDCRNLFELFEREISQVLPTHIKIEALAAAVVNSARKNPKLLRCTKGSVLSGLMQCGATGLLPDTPAQECHLVPFENKKKGIVECVWMAGYRGLLKLTRQSGIVGNAGMEVVYEGDEFDYEKGATPVLVHKPKLVVEARKDADIRFFYAIAWWLNPDIRPGFEFEVMSLAQVEAIKNASRGKDQDPWRIHFAEQGRKTVFRRLAKKLPLSPELMMAVHLDNMAAVGETQPIHDTVAEIVEPPEKPPTKKLADDLKKKAGEKKTKEPPEAESQAKEPPAAAPPKEEPVVTIKDVTQLMEEHGDRLPPEIREKYGADHDWDAYTAKGLEEVMDELRGYIDAAEDSGASNPE